MGTHSISAPLAVAGGNLVIAESGNGLLGISGNITDDNLHRSLTLAGDGTGVLVLSGTNSYGGATVVQAGTLIVNTSAALPAGTSLSVGAGGTFLFDPSVVAPTVSSQGLAASPAGAVEAVPEPGTIALLLAALWSAAIYRRLATRHVSRTAST